MAGLLAAWRGGVVRAARCRARVPAARADQQGRNRTGGSASTALRILAALIAVTFFCDAAQAQWPFGKIFRPSAESTVVSTTPHPAVARIMVDEKDGVSFGTGSLVDARGNFGLVITNWHVIRDASGEIRVDFPGGFRTPAKVLKFDADWDLAALEIARPVGIQPLPISSALPRKSESLVIAGYGAGNYRAAAGKCQQYLAPKEGMPFEMVEIGTEARQGDSGGPILNERGEMAGVLFGAGNGFTAGSYGGRVLAFLSSVVPDGRPGSDLPTEIAGNAIAQGPMPTLSPTADHVPRSDPFVALAPQVEDQLKSMAEPSSTGKRVPLNRLESAPAPEEGLALVPLPPLRTGPGDAREGTQPPMLDSGTTTITPLSPAEADRAPTASPLKPTPADAAITPAEGPPAPVSLAPRKGALESGPRTLNEAPADQLLAVAWNKIGGTTLVEQIKTVLAGVGVLGILVTLWRWFSRDEKEEEPE